ncbi:hypothetical protein [Thermogemmatispora onikobensis]|uniref:hypothetical protein n=1 Tax=Thermogemmatispora onikobensis TaxID=732234 RepID=UPI00114CAF1B|nr:hypothetical protein [Thermogemmatispora onikobensis]
MIARKLSQWLARLFAWWPGRKRRSQMVAAEASGASSAHALTPRQPPLPGTPTSTSPSAPASGLASQAGPSSRYSFLLEGQDLFLPPKLTAPPGALGGLPSLDYSLYGFPSPLADPHRSLSERLRWIWENDPFSSGEVSAEEETQTGAEGGELGDSSPAALLQQRRLEFLRYLVKRGLVNEGFDQENLPEQYRGLP